MNGIRAASYVQIKTRTLRRAVMVCKTAGSGPLHVRAADGDGVNRQAGTRVFSPVESQKATGQESVQ